MPYLSSRRRAVAPAAVSSPARSRARLGLVAAAGLVFSCAGAAPAFAADTQAPSQPGTLTTTDTGPGTTTLTWGASTDDVGVAEYDVFDGTNLLAIAPGTATQASITVTVQGGFHTYAFTVRAKDAAGNVSAPSNTVSRGTCSPGSALAANAATDFTASAITDTTATISWKRGVQDWCHQVPTGYVVVVDGVAQPSVAASTTSTVLTGLKPGTSYTIGVRALPFQSLGSTQNPPIVVTTTGNNPTDSIAPTAPGSPTAASGTDGVTVRWGASTDNVGVKEYDLFDAAGGLIQAVDGGTTASKFPRTSNTPGPATVAARDAAGNLSARIAITPSTCPALGPNAASPPRNVAVTPFSQDGRQFAAVTWDAPAVLDCTYAASYVDVFLGEDGAAPTLYGTGDLSQGPPTPTNGGFSLVLEPGHSYRLYTQGRATTDGGYVSSLPTPTISFVAGGGPVPVAVPYTVKGSAALKTNVKGSVPLAGTATGSVDTATGAFTADLTLGTSKANLTALGFLPVAATVKLVPTAPVTGQLTGASLKALAKVQIKLTSLKAFGTQLVTGANCQSTKASNVSLASTAFTPGIGGTLTGTFSIGALSGCGSLTSLVSALATGSGNTVSLKLTA